MLADRVDIPEVLLESLLVTDGRCPRAAVYEIHSLDSRLDGIRAGQRQGEYPRRCSVWAVSASAIICGDADLSASQMWKSAVT